MSTRCNIEFYDDSVTEFGEPAARIYQHGDGYPEGQCGILAELKKLERRLLGKDEETLKTFPHPYDKTKTAADHARIYGTRTNDPEWAAAEFITMFRSPMGGNIYVAQQNHGDIAFLYRVICKPDKLEVHVFEPQHDDKYDITGYTELSPSELRKRQAAETARLRKLRAS